MNFVLVPDSQTLVSNNFVDYPDESDLNGGVYPYGLYPMPTNQPIEGWPTQTGGADVAAMADEQRRQRPAFHHRAAGRGI